MDYYKLKVLNNKRKIIIILIVITIIGALIFYYFYYYKNDNKDIEIININEDEKIVDNIDDKLLYVDIKGNVLMPGVYSFKISDDARINDLILKAGGLKKDADTSILNLSKKLEDEMTVIIYSKNEVDNYVKTQELLKNKLEVCELKLKNNACIEEKVNNEKKQININNATKEELMSLTGIGENKALAIIEYRKKTSFKDIKDLLNVEGIGESILEAIKDNITV